MQILSNYCFLKAYLPLHQKKTPRISGRKHYFQTFRNGTALLTSRGLRSSVVAVALEVAIAGVVGLVLALGAIATVATATVAGYSGHRMEWYRWGA